jgi:hypothetical protein
LLWEPLQIGGNNSFFFFTIPFWRWIFIQKKNSETTILFFLIFSFPCVCVCVWRNNRKSLSGLCVYYTMRQPHLSTEMCRHRERKPTHTPPKTWGTWKGT